MPRKTVNAQPKEKDIYLYWFWFTFTSGEIEDGVDSRVLRSLVTPFGKHLVKLNGLEMRQEGTNRQCCDKSEIVQYKCSNALEP